LPVEVSRYFVEILGRSITFLSDPSDEPMSSYPAPNSDPEAGPKVESAADVGSTELLPSAGRLPGDDAVNQSINPFTALDDPTEDAVTVIRRTDGGSYVRMPERTNGSSPAEVAKVLLGSRLSHFHLEELIGGGGMGAVFRARDERLDRTVAIKVIPFIGDDPDMQRRFRNEAQAAARLDHPNIARVFDVGMSEGWRYIVFEYIQGTNIRDLVSRDGVLSIDDAVFYTRQIAEALHHASGRGVVHRDVKPSNVLVNSEGDTKLVDMGLARSDQLEFSGDMTASGVTLGTFDYISPEQARDPRDADVRSDIYSLGCTLYFMLIGEPPYPGGTVLQKLLNHGNAPPPDPTAVRSDISDDLRAIIFKMLAKSPDMRYQRAIDLVADLRELAERESLVKASSQGTVAINRDDVSPGLWIGYLPWMITAMALLIGAMFLQTVDSLRGDAFRLEVPASAMKIGSGLSVEAGSIESTNPAEGVVVPGGVQSGNEAIAPAARRDPSGLAPQVPSDVGNEFPFRPDQGSELAKSVSQIPGNSQADQAGPVTESASLSNRNPAPVAGEEAIQGPRFSEIAMARDSLGSTPAAPAVDDPGATDGLKVVISRDSRIWPEGVTRANDLQEALALAKQLGIDLIEIAEPVIESLPIRIPANGLTIRSAVQATEVRFRSDSVPAMQRETMIDVGSNRIDFEGLNFVWKIGSRALEGGALFSLSNHDRIRMNACTVTIEGGSDREEFYAFEISLPTEHRPLISDLGTDPFSLRDEIQTVPMDGPLAVRSRQGAELEVELPPRVVIEMKDVVCRGEMSLINLIDPVLVELRWDNGFLAVSGRMFEIAGSQTDLRQGDMRVQLELRRLTAVTPRGFIRTRLGPSGRYPVPIGREATDCVFKSPPGIPHIEFIGLGPEFPKESLLVLRGSGNAYDFSLSGPNREFSASANDPILRTVSASGARDSVGVREISAIQRPAWAAERSPLMSLRWANPPDVGKVASQLTPPDFYLEGAVDVGFDRDNLPACPRNPVYELPAMIESVPGVDVGDRD